MWLSLMLSLPYQHKVWPYITLDLAQVVNLRARLDSWFWTVTARCPLRGSSHFSVHKAHVSELFFCFFKVQYFLDQFTWYHMIFCNVISGSRNNVDDISAKKQKIKNLQIQTEAIWYKQHLALVISVSLISCSFIQHTDGADLQNLDFRVFKIWKI